MRFADIIYSVIFFIAAIIPLCIFSLLKIIIDGTPLFYKSNRVGHMSKPIPILKFRTMVIDREMVESEVKKYSSLGFQSIPLSSPAYTKIGRIFEKYQIVEIPQLFSIFLGDMSFIGNRPLPKNNSKALIKKFGKNTFNLRQSIKPGLTGLSQILGKDAQTPEERIRNECVFSLFVMRSSPFRVLYVYHIIMIETFLLIFLGKKPLTKFILKYIYAYSEDCSNISHI